MNVAKKRPSSKRSTRSRRVRGATRVEPDDGARGPVGLVATLVARDAGSMRLVFDDARLRRSGRWEPVRLFTSRDYPADALRELRVARSELQTIGELVVARLVALATRAREGR